MSPADRTAWVKPARKPAKPAVFKEAWSVTFIVGGPTFSGTPEEVDRLVKEYETGCAIAHANGRSAERQSAALIEAFQFGYGEIKE